MRNKYTFLLPAYKIKYFQEALDSILNQTYKDFKLIIQDDCSPFDIKSIVDKYSYDKRVYYYRNEVNIGGKNLVKCWNNLLEKADSEYIILASDDDVYDIHFLDEIDKLTNKYPQVDLLRARVKSISANGELRGVDAIYEEYGDSIYFLYQKHFNNNITCIACYAFKLKVLKEKGGFVDLPLAWHSDDATALNVCNNGIANTQKTLLYFRTSGINISSRELSSSDAKKKAIASILYHDIFINIVNKLYRTINNSPLHKRMYDFAIYNHNDYNYRMINYFSYKCNFFDFIDILKKSNHKIKLLFKYIRNKIFGY